MDPLVNLNPLKDTTLAMLNAAYRLGWESYCFDQSSLYTENGHVYAALSKIEVKHLKNRAGTHVTALGMLPLDSLDIILMRKDPPFNMEYIYATYALNLVEKTGVLVANNPQSLRDANEKFFTLNFPQCCPPTLVSCNLQHLHNFWQTHQKVIFKPLNAMGGQSVFYVDEKGTNLPVILELLTKNATMSIMAQLFIPDIKESGDKRILIMNGEPVPFALARIPASDDLRGNLAAGAKGLVVPITERDRYICQELAPTLKAKGLYFVGVDIIGDYLTEINVTSPTCLQEIAKETNLDLATEYLGHLKNYL